MRKALQRIQGGVQGFTITLPVGISIPGIDIIIKRRRPLRYCIQLYAPWRGSRRHDRGLLQLELRAEPEGGVVLNPRVGALAADAGPDRTSTCST